LRRVQKELIVTAGKLLAVELETGATLAISGWDKETVRLDVYWGGRDWRGARAQLEETSSGVRATTRYEGDMAGRSLDPKVEIKVPRRFDVSFSSAGGDISITNVEGKIAGHTMGGELELEGLKGEVDLTTGGGGITMSNSAVDGRVETKGGPVLIQNVEGDVRGSSMGGEVIYRPRAHSASRADSAGAPSDGVKRLSLTGGDINLDDAPDGADVSTMGGDIHIRSAAKFVKAHTEGGNISIGSVAGSLRAGTLAGNVDATLSGEDGERNVEITSNLGDITLSVPAALSMYIHIELEQTVNSGGSYEILSDFAIEQKGPGELVYDRGAPRRFIYGNGLVAGGRNRIFLKTINGNITLRKR
jgi:DUF4097 and DUF4098 domain-containing protein YvlB